MGSDESEASDESSDSEDKSVVESDTEYQTSKKTHRTKKARVENRAEEVPESKAAGEGLPKADISVQLNVDDLTEHF